MINDYKFRFTIKLLTLHVCACVCVRACVRMCVPERDCSAGDTYLPPLGLKNNKIGGITTLILGRIIYSVIFYFLRNIECRCYEFHDKCTNFLPF